MSDATSHRRAYSAYAPSSSSAIVSGGGVSVSGSGKNPFDAHPRDDSGYFGEDDDLLGLGDGGGAGSALGRNGSVSGSSSGGG